LLDSLAIKRVVLVGWSLGGNELNEFAVRYPDRVAGLVYLECYDLGAPAFGRLLQHFPLALSPSANDLKNAAAFRDWWNRTNAPGLSLTPAMQAEIADVMDQRPDGSVSVVPDDSTTAALWAGMQYHPQYAAIKAPILAMWGRWFTGGLVPPTAPDSIRQKVGRFLKEDAWPVQDSAIAQLRKAVPSARIVVLDSAGHSAFPFVNRDTIVAEMRRFLAQPSR
jgi:pimeloyl-ACP methyl ester carboxylesterase